ncbi:MAG TPA: ABC transporter substrate-binding protein/permease [Burkholderiales bacterium]|nr:ABC transporter substrate-binding protein/permease [Burkholderiales bacterium]
MRPLIFLAMLVFVAGPGKAAAAAPAADGAAKADLLASVQPASPNGTGSKLSEVDELKDRRVGVLQGSAHVEYVEKTWPRATLLQYNTPADLLLAVKTGKVDAALSDAEPLRAMLRQDKTLGMLGGSLFSFPEGVGFGKENTVLLDQFNQFLARLQQSGIHADMVDRWMEKNIIDMPTIANSGSNGELVVGISDGSLPFVAIKDNRLIGFEIELSERFGAYLGKKVRFSQIDFSGLIAAAATGKVDMIIAAIFITDERRQSINFSDPYYEEATRVFGLKKNIAAYGTSITDSDSGVPFFTRVAASFHSNIIREKRYLLLWEGLKATVLISILATILGTVLGALICYMRMARQSVLNVPARVYISVLRGLPVLVLLMFIFYVAFASVNVDPLLVAVIAFGLNFAAYAAEIFRSGIEGIDRGQTEAGIAMGFGRFSTFIHIVLPQTVQRILPVYRGEFISLVKMTSIVGYIAVQDLTKAGDIIRSRTFDAFFPLVVVAVLYFLISWVLMLALEYVERSTDPQRRREQAVRQ